MYWIRRFHCVLGKSKSEYYVCLTGYFFFVNSSVIKQLQASFDLRFWLSVIQLSNIGIANFMEWSRRMESWSDVVELTSLVRILERYLVMWNLTHRVKTSSFVSESNKKHSIFIFYHELPLNSIVNQ